MIEINTKLCTEGVIDSALEEKEKDYTEKFNPLRDELQDKKILL